MAIPRIRPAELRKAIRALLEDSQLSDAELRGRLEALAKEHPAFNGFTWLWGPVLYKRNRVFFRPFILGRFSNFMIVSRYKWQPIRWKGFVGETLDQWLAEADRLDDAELFRQLYTWKITPIGSWRINSKVYREELIRRIKAASTPAASQVILRKFDTWFELDELTAIQLYAAAPAAAGPYIFKRLPWGWSGEKRKLWEELFRRAQEGGDAQFAWRLYRRQAPLARWEDDALARCEIDLDPVELNASLERLHPEGTYLDLGKTFIRLIEKRGRDVLPYTFRHLRQVFSFWLGFGSYGRMLEIAKQREWLDLWAALVRTCARTGEFNAEIRSLLEESGLADGERIRRLHALTGVSREWNLPGFGAAQVHQLDESTALKLYERFPELARGPFKMHLQLSLWGARYGKLIDRFLSAEDEIMLDFITSRMVTRGGWYFATEKRTVEIDKLADYYEGLRQKDETAFSRRAANALGQVPAFSIYHYNHLIKHNRLARLLFERSAEKYLSDPHAVSDLVEASEIHVMALGYRALGADDDRARALAAAHLPLLLGTLLRPLRRATRLLAFRALLNAATTPENARVILQRARDAMHLPDLRYPKDQLVSLIGQLLHRWPDLRGSREQPVVYRRMAA